MNRLVIPALCLLVFSCHKDDEVEVSAVEYKQKMREFVIGISQYAKSKNPGFSIIPQNGIELVTENGDLAAQLQTNYLNAIDANGQEDLFFGYDADDQPTPTDVSEYLMPYLNLSKDADNIILVTDYCVTPSKVESSYQQNANAGYISFAANERELTTIPGYPAPIHEENANVITQVGQVKNFLYLINPSNFSDKNQFIAAVAATNYDLLIMDLFFTDGSAFTESEVNQLRNKKNGGKRLVVAYMSIGEAEDYRYYWQSSWSKNPPGWMDAEDPDWPGNYKVKYWDSEWQAIIYGNDNSYAKKILDAGFDGAYLDIIDAFEYFEK